MKRDLVLEVDPSLYPSIEGSTDSEVLFYLALTFGLEDDPVAAMERAIGFVEATGHRHGIEHPVPGHVATSDGDRLWAFRYSSEGRRARSSSARPFPSCARCTPTTSVRSAVDDESRLVVSEPLGDVPGAWNRFRSRATGSSRMAPTCSARSHPPRRPSAGRPSASRLPPAPAARRTA